MRKLTILLLLVLLSAFAGAQMAGQQNVPPCTAAAPTNCTDYFGVANYANSPLPAGTIVGFTLMAGGSGYTAPQVFITDPTGTGASATATVDPNGVITAINLGGGGTGYIAPQITITDPTGTGAMATANIGPPFTGGIRKFVDSLASLTLAKPDTTTFPGSDYYVIGLVPYSQKMHSDLPATALRGYCQINVAGGCSPSYLGPVILAQRNRPVRVLFKNMLPSVASGGNLPIPVDTTYMGAGMAADNTPYLENRATLHLHGGNTPWISDGTPHQWTVPAVDAGSTTHPRGDSTAFVPDMWFDGAGNVFAAPAPGLTNDPGPGNMTFFWTNQQGGRLMFYHDHAYGITRLNVYAGEAAGYLLSDPVQEAALANATAPGTVTATPDLNHLLPLVIQDKTFVPAAAQLAAEDPTWTIGGFGSSPGNAVLGDLWFPHVYVPNQNPLDPDGVNAYGRWDYGPWFFPPQTSLTAGPLTIPCISSAFPGATLDCPIVPNASGTPEGFMDTPLVNGVVYPKLTVSPAAYRLQILNAANDRSWSLQFYQADATGTEVTMMPAVPPASGTPLPLCSTPTAITQPALGIGLATATLDSVGNPINNTGLPAGCWPTSWPTDGRDGGVPDPRTAGPPFIQIGTEGGLLPAPVVIPSTPTGFEYNRRSVTVLNVGSHGLWLGPAERADAIVDFSAFAGKTLILYNDAPAPAPAFDTRYDYYTGDPDQSSAGGAPATQPGYGPNTRTIMQIYVDPNLFNPNTQTFSLAALKAAFATTSTQTGLFASTQPTIIVPESGYNTAYNKSLSNTYSTIQATTLTFNPLAPQMLVQPGPGVTPCTATAPNICVTMEQKAIQELFTADYGRMNATLGTELPLTSFLNQTTIPLGYIDPATEILRDGETQLWKITHNGVDTHFIHFHLFNVQVVNRMGWDGTTRPPDANELGWKDTVRMNPLEDILVAMQATKQILPWPLPDSVRLMDVTTSAGSTMGFTGVNPFTNTPAASPNAITNFGQEYVWHCHILGHEENDMMRPIVFQVAPPAPSNLNAALQLDGSVQLSFTDNSANETGFTIQRDIDPLFPNPVSLSIGPSTGKLNQINQGVDWGSSILASDPTPPVGQALFYRVQAIDDGFHPLNTQQWNATAPTISEWSNIASLGPSPNATVAPSPLTFGSQLVGTTSSPLSVTITNAAGAGVLAISSVSITGASASQFAITANNCDTSVAAGNSCAISVTFTPTISGAAIATLNIVSTNPTSLPVPISGTGVAPIDSVSPLALSFGNVTVNTTSSAQTVTIANSGSSALTLTSFAISGGNATDFAISNNTCPVSPATLAISGSCTVSVTMKPAAMGTRSSVLVINSSDPVTPRVDVSLTGVGTEAIATVAPGSLTYGLQLVNTSSAAQTVTLSNTGNIPMNISSIAVTGTNATDFVINYNCSLNGAGLANGASCTISVTFRPLAAGLSRTGNLVISTNALAPTGGTVTVPLSASSTGVNLSTTALTFAPQVVGTTSAYQSVTLTNAGTTPLIISSVANVGGQTTDFTLTNNCPIGGTGLAVGASCRVTVRFAPKATGVRTTTLTIASNDPGMPSGKIVLTGTGIQAAVSLSPTTWNFGGVTRRQTSTPLVVTLANSGTASLTINRISLGGANPGQFLIRSTTCGTSLAINASCTITVVFAPTGRGPFSATLQVADNAPGSPQTVALSGTGL